MYRVITENNKKYVTFTSICGFKKYLLRQNKSGVYYINRGIYGKFYFDIKSLVF